MRQLTISRHMRGSRCRRLATLPNGLALALALTHKSLRLYPTTPTQIIRWTAPSASHYGMYCNGPRHCSPTDAEAGCSCAIPSPQDARTSGVECHCVGVCVSCVAQFRLQAELLLHRSGQWSETRGRMIRPSRKTWMRMSCRINVPATQRIFWALAVVRRMGLYILLRQSNVYDSQHPTIYRHQCPLH